MDMLFRTFASKSLLIVRAASVGPGFAGSSATSSRRSGKGHGFEMNLALTGMALAVLVGGAGALSIDRWLHAW